MDTCIDCYYNVLPEAIFVVYIFSFGGTYIPAMNICLHAQNFNFGGVMVLAVQLFNKIKQKEKTKNMNKHVSLYFLDVDVMSKYIYFW